MTGRGAPRKLPGEGFKRSRPPFIRSCAVGCVGVVLLFIAAIVFLIVHFTEHLARTTAV